MADHPHFVAEAQARGFNPIDLWNKLPPETQDKVKNAALAGGKAAWEDIQAGDNRRAVGSILSDFFNAAKAAFEAPAPSANPAPAQPQPQQPQQGQQAIQAPVGGRGIPAQAGQFVPSAIPSSAPDCILLLTLQQQHVVQQPHPAAAQTPQQHEAPHPSVLNSSGHVEFTSVGDRLDATGHTGPAKLAEGQKLTSRNGKYVVVLQHDGNLVGYHGERYFWNTVTQGKGVAPRSLEAQPDGNVVLYDAHRTPLWHTHTCSPIHHQAIFVMQDDRNVVVYENSRAAWASNTCGSD